MRIDRRAKQIAPIASTVVALSFALMANGAFAQQYGAPQYGATPPALPYPPGTSAPAQPSYATQPSYGARPNYGAQPGFGGQPNYPAPPNYGAPPAYGGQPPYGAQAPYAAPPQYGAPPAQMPYGQPPWQQRPGYGAAGQSSPLDKMIPEFGKALPQVPPSMSQPMPPGPGWGSGYAPAARPTPQADSLEGRVLRLEQSAFGSTYPEHEVDDRLEHLEREVFGKVTEGGDSESRVQRLEAKLGGGSGAFGRSSSVPASTPPAYRPPMQTAYQAPQSAYQPPPPAMQPPPSGYMQPSQQMMQPPTQKPPMGMGSMPPAMGVPAMPAAGTPYMPPAGSPYANGQQQSGFNSTYHPPAQPSAPVTPPPEEKPMVATAQHYLPPGFTSQAVPPYAKPAASPATPAPPKDQQSSEFQTAVQSIKSDAKAGDYFANIQRYAGSNYARWTNFPVRVHIPMNTPDAWKTSLESSIHKWSQAVPVMIASPQEPADIEVAWINHLQPRQLGITNLEIFNGRMRVTVYLLRPTYYPPDVNEKLLPIVVTHEMGHALGLWGHSNAPGDIMQTLEVAKGRQATVSQRDMNTLRRVYESPSLPEGFQSPQPIGWAFTHYAPLRK